MSSSKLFVAVRSFDFRPIFLFLGHRLLSRTAEVSCGRESLFVLSSQLPFPGLSFFGGGRDSRATEAVLSPLLCFSFS